MPQRTNTSTGFALPLTRRPGIVPEGESLPPSAAPIDTIALRCQADDAAFEALLDELRRRVRAMGGTFAGRARVHYAAGRLHLRATAMYWPGAVPAG